MTSEPLHNQVVELQERVNRLEKYLGIQELPVTPGFDPMKFQRVLMSYWMLMWIAFIPLFAAGPVITLFQGYVSEETLLGLPLVNAGTRPSFLGLPIGIIALGGGAIGLLSCGGLAIG